MLSVGVCEILFDLVNLFLFDPIDYSYVPNTHSSSGQ